MKKKNQIEYKVEIRDGIRFMECRCCGTMSKVSPDATATTCWKCVNENFEKDFPFTPKTGYVSSGKPRGWAFMKEFVDKDGNVYHRGKEQPQLKGTLKPTVIKNKPAKKRLTKREKQKIAGDALVQIHMLKKQLAKAKYKKDVRRINSQIKKLQKLIK